MRCVDCTHYPWVLTSDPGMMFPMKCHPDLEARRWTNQTKESERHCPYFNDAQGEPFVAEKPSGDNAGGSGFVNEENFSAKELRARADELGIEYKNGATKKHLVKLINDYLKG